MMQTTQLGKPQPLASPTGIHKNTQMEQSQIQLPNGLLPSIPQPTPTSPTAPPLSGNLNPTVPPGGIPSTPVAQDPQPNTFAATSANPLAPLNNYQPQQQQGSYQPPAFQGANSYQAGTAQAPQITSSYQSQSQTAPTINAGNYQAGSIQAPQVAGAGYQSQGVSAQ